MSDVIGFAVLPADIARDGSVSLAHKGLMLVISSFTNSRLGYAWPAVDTLAAAVGLSERQTQKHLRDMETLGTIEIIHTRTDTGGCGTNRYKLKFDRWGGVSNPTGGGVVGDGGRVSSASPNHDHLNNNQTPSPSVSAPKGADLFPEVKAKAKRFTPPTSAEAQAYFRERGCHRTDEASKFVDFYESKGWIVGRVKMKDWKAAARNWLRGSNNNRGGSAPKQGRSDAYDWSNHDA